MEFALMNVQHAKEKREKVQAAVDKYGGPQNIVEFGGQQLPNAPQTELGCVPVWPGFFHDALQAL